MAALNFSKQWNKEMSIQIRVLMDVRGAGVGRSGMVEDLSLSLSLALSLSLSLKKYVLATEAHTEIFSILGFLGVIIRMIIYRINLLKGKEIFLMMGNLDS